MPAGGGSFRLRNPACPWGRLRALRHFRDPDSGRVPAGHRPGRDVRVVSERPAARCFTFLLMDADGRVLGGEGPYPIGSVAPAAVQAKSAPIRVGDEVVARAFPLSEPNLTPADRAYLDSIREALITGALLSLGVTLLLGLLLGNRMSLGLRRLTDAVRAIGRGQLRQRVAIPSKDEVGLLSEAFNRMSGELERAHAELTQSQERIREQAELLREQSLRDSLTGLHNRRFVAEHGERLLAQAQRYGQPFSVMVGDLDFFKRINDTFSHTMGDRVLQQIAVLLRRHTRDADLVARFGGEEFVILFPQTSLRDVEKACETLRRVIEQHPWHDLHPDLRVTMSIGVSDGSRAECLDQILARADGRLYEAKRGGRNQVVTGRPAALPDNGLDLRDLTPV